MTNLNWFKIYEDGLDVNNQTWGVDRMIANKGKVTFQIPSCIASGQYLLRHEMIGSSLSLPVFRSFLITFSCPCSSPRCRILPRRPILRMCKYLPL